MILLFGDKAASSKASKSGKNSNIKNHPVENSGILAMGLNGTRSLLTVNEYDTYIFSNPFVVDYTMYSNGEYSADADGFGFMGAFSSAMATLGDCGFSAGGFDCGGSSFSGASCSSFSSVG